jgi:hypothetical protein
MLFFFYSVVRGDVDDTYDGAKIPISFHLARTQMYCRQGRFVPWAEKMLPGEGCFVITGAAGRKEKGFPPVPGKKGHLPFSS